MLCQGNLRLARAAAEVVEALAVHPAFPFRQGGRQVPGAQGAQQQILGAGFLLHHWQGFLALGHGALAHDLAGDDEIETLFANPFVSLAHHEDLAVQAGIQVRAIAVLRIDDHILVLLDDIDDMQLDVQLLGHPKCIVALRLVLVLLADGMGVPLDAEAGEEVDALDVYALLLHHLGGQQGIESSGDQGNGFAFHGKAAGKKKGR